MSNDALKTWKAGEVIFNIGDPGGELHFIKEGEVSIYKVVDNSEVELATLSKDEIIGVMTLFSDARRTANAKAISEVSSLVVSRQQIKKLMDQTPDWMKALIKDLMARVDNANDKFVASEKKLDQANRRRVSSMSRALQVANAVGLIGSYIFDAGDGSKPIEYTEILQKTTYLFNEKPHDIDLFLKMFMEAGLINRDAKEAGIPPGRVVKVGKFSKYTKTLIESKDMYRKKLALTHRDLMQLEGLIRMVKILNADPKNEVEISYSDLTEFMEKNAKIQFNSLSMEKLALLGIIEVCGDDDSRSVKFFPLRVRDESCFIRLIKAIEKRDREQKVA